MTVVSFVLSCWLINRKRFFHWLKLKAGNKNGQNNYGISGATDIFINCVSRRLELAKMFVAKAYSIEYLAFNDSPDGDGDEIIFDQKPENV